MKLTRTIIWLQNHLQVRNLHAAARVRAARGDELMHQECVLAGADLTLVFLSALLQLVVCTGQRRLAQNTRKIQSKRLSCTEIIA